MTSTEPGGAGEDEREPHDRRRCSWCGRVEIDGLWVERAAAPDVEGREGHSVCPDCFDSLLSQ